MRGGAADGHAPESGSDVHGQRQRAPGGVESGLGLAEPKPPLPRPPPRPLIPVLGGPAWGEVPACSRGGGITSEMIEDEQQFYSKAETYWKQIPPTVDGMLGGYGHISSIDLSSSRKFLQRFLREGPDKPGTSCALDCGAGIGRITKQLLLPLFEVVDMVDVTEDFLAKARTYLGEEGKRVRNYFCCGLQDFSPEPGSYDVIWIQWVIGHLTDQHLAEFLRRCKHALRPNGLIVIKDNMAQEGVILDDVDSSVCRELEVVRRIVHMAGLSLLAEERQENLPEEIYPVYSLALR
ncbi:N-terminal Xaa-Pro-Lys N-methyltransferase 1 isoform X3 [Heterocephalus glaber]|uniref:N-terminal Xaa-Pro-Lys N-methyltransferase 1 n=1 Tax=Heterocephalus glaber TaxID=10181 RepID=A0A0P6J650_HETGA|nr:N-terminal Xaa-Pro-Lys N-methyltransferase 1 isoform X3 [Heterocephalus glaber]